MSDQVRLHTLTLKSIRDETVDARSFVFSPPPGARHLYRYSSGQFLTFRIPLQTDVIERSYSFSSARCCDPDLMVCVKRVERGRGSNWFHDHLKVGARIEATAPAGRFVLRDTERPAFLVAGGSGITPCISLVKSLLFETGRQVKLVYANRDEASVIYRAPLDALAARFEGRFTCEYWLDAQNGFMAKSDIASRVAGWEDADIYICGPASLMDLAEATLGEVCGEKARILIEHFSSPDQPEPEPEVAPEPVGAPDLDRFRLTLDGEDHDIALTAGQTLLAAAIAAGIDAPHSCTEGRCGACMAVLKSGDVTMASTRALSKRNIANGYVLTCQSTPSSSEPLWLDFDA